MAKINEMPMNALPLKRFTWNKQTRTLVAEASDFGALRDGLWWLQQLRNDACDIGIAIRSEISDREERFYLHREESRDGDFLAWHFKPVNPLANVGEVTIFND